MSSSVIVNKLWYKSWLFKICIHSVLIEFDNLDFCSIQIPKTFQKYLPHIKLMSSSFFTISEHNVV
jgi:hypothetical protein